MHIRKAVNFALVKYAKINVTVHPSQSIIESLARTAKGSKKFRLVISGAQQLKTMGINSIRTLGQLLSIDLPLEDDKAGRLLGLWNRSYWPVDIKTFIFQLYNNSLPVGARLQNRHRLNPDTVIDERCKLCKVGFNVAPRETFQHIFFECDKTQYLLNRIKIDITGVDYDVLTFKKRLFRHEADDGCFDEILCIGNILFLYEIWHAKLCHKAPSIATIKENIIFKFDGIVRSAVRLKNIALYSENYWCRNWRLQLGVPDGYGRG